MPRQDVSIATRDGVCPAGVFTPDDAPPPWPAALFFMDGLGIRPVMAQMAQRLADAGYLVLLPDLYYRRGPYPPVEPKVQLADTRGVQQLMQWVATLDRDRKVSDAQSFIRYLDSRDDIAGDRYGATGYCMGGNVALSAAGALGDRFACVASFHGGGLASEAPDSPHRFVRAITGTVYVAGASDDPHFPDDQKLRLEQALAGAGVAHRIETYAGAAHGFAVPDVPAYDAAADARHWAALLELFEAMLSQPTKE